MIKVTVIIAAWNARSTLPRAVASCLAQEDVEIEVLVVDDASSDDTGAVANTLAESDARIRVMRQIKNGGPGAARNAGLSLATGDWIAVLDADDTMTPSRLSTLVDFGVKQGADAVYDNLAIVDVTSKDLSQKTYLNEPEFRQPARWDLAFYIENNQARPGRPSLGYLKPVIKREFAEQHSLRYLPNLRNGEDFHLMLDLLVAGGLLWFLPEANYRYATGGASISNRLNLDHAHMLIAESTKFIEQNTGDLSPATIKLMQKRRDNLADFTCAEKAMRALKKLRFGEALMTIARRPRSLLRLSQQLTQAVVKRLR